MDPELCVLRGGGDLATGVAYRLTRAGWPVIVCELAEPLAIRRTVSLAAAVDEGMVEIEGMVGRRADDLQSAVAIARNGEVGVVVSPGLPPVPCDVLVDARLAKRDIDTTIDDAPLVIGIGPGFEAGVDCHAVVESLRGHHLGRLFWEGQAAADTGEPGLVGGRSSDRVLRALRAGVVTWRVAIGARVEQDELLGTIEDRELRAPFDGVVRGLIRSGMSVPESLKIADIDPRSDPAACWEISDKALAIGGGVLEAVLTWRHLSR